MVFKYQLHPNAAKGLRGLTFKPAEEAIKVEPVTVIMTLGVELKPGEDTPVNVTMKDLPRNANVESITAEISISPASGEMPTLDQASAITMDGGEERSFDVSVSTPNLPRTVSVKLDGGEVFWTHSANQVEGTLELTDLVDPLNEYLDRLDPEASPVTLAFLVQVDGPGFVWITIKDVKYSVIQTQSWRNPLDETIRLDRTLELTFGEVQRLELDALANDTGNVNLAKINLDLSGEFQPERLFGSVVEHDGHESAIVSRDYAIAQAFRFDKPDEDSGRCVSATPIQSVGLSASIEVADETEVYCEIQADAHGQPAVGEPLAMTNLTLQPTEEGSGSQMTSVRFEAPVELAPETTYWLLMKGIRGAARVGVQVQSDSCLHRLLVNRGGESWKPFGGPVSVEPSALMRVLYLPDVDNQTAAVEIAVETTDVTARMDPQNEAETVSLDLPLLPTTKSATLVVKSLAEGTVNVANVIQEFTPSGTYQLFHLVEAQLMDNTLASVK